MQSVIICQKCGTKNSSNATACKSCNASLGIICSNCGRLNSQLLNFCENCGEVLAKNPLEEEKEFEAERLHLNIMFCDLVGSTSLSETLDPEAFLDIVLAYQEVSAR